MQAGQRLGRGLDRTKTLRYVMLGQQGHGFSVRLGDEPGTKLCKLGAQFAEVFDDPVMHNRDGARLMRVRIGHRGRAMGGPAGMADTGLARERFMHQQIGQIDQLSNSASAAQMAIVDCGDTGAVIAAIFQTFQRFNKDGRHFVLPQDPDNTAHN